MTNPVIIWRRVDVCANSVSGVLSLIVAHLCGVQEPLYGVPTIQAPRKIQSFARFRLATSTTSGSVMIIATESPSSAKRMRTVSAPRGLKIPLPK
jgi:hypothetical protein